jgi:hypothetical protein
MKLKLELLLNKRRLDVWRAFDNQENLKRWQPTLQSVQHIQGTPGHEGSVAVLTYNEKGRRVILEQVILEKSAPERYSTTSYGEHSSNRVVNTFVADAATQTRWELEATYRFRGMWRLLTPLLRPAIRRQTLTEMERFKKFVEET